MKQLVFAVFFIFIVRGVSSAGPFILNDNLTRTNIIQNMEYYADKEGSMSVDDIESRALQWSEPKEDAINFGFTSTVYWFRLNVVNDGEKKIPWFIEIDYPMINFIKLYSPDEKGGFTVKETGNGLPFGHRDIKHRNFVFALETKPGTSTYFMRIQTRGSVNFKAYAWAPSKFFNNVFYELPLYWIYYGLMMVMFVYNLLLFMSIRERSYILYTIFIAFWILFQMTLNGLSFQHLWPNSIWWANNCLPLFMGMSTVM